MGVRTAVHEQNAVLGRVNRLVAGKVDAIATSYPDTQRIKAGCEARCGWSAIPCAPKFRTSARGLFPRPMAG